MNWKPYAILQLAGILWGITPSWGAPISPKKPVQLDSCERALCTSPFPQSTLGNAARSNAHNDEMIVTRGVAKYLERFGSPLAQALVSLLEQSRKTLLLDAGSGDGIFAQEIAGIDTVGVRRAFTRTTLAGYEDLERLILSQHNLLHVSAISLAMKKPGKDVPKIKYSTGRYFEDISNTEISTDFGAVDLITDYYGVLSYTASPDVVLEKYWSLLSSGGKAFIFLDSESIDQEKVVRNDGSSLSLLEWIKSLGGFDFVPIENPSTGKTSRGAFYLIKKGGTPRIPRLSLEEYKKGSPPTRAFREI